MSRIAFQRAFQELTEDELAAVLDGAREISFDAEQRLMREGEDQHRIYVILEGEVRVVRYGRDGREAALSEPLGPGDTVGEMSFIDGLGASATLIATTPVVARYVDEEVLDAVSEGRPEFLRRFYHSLLYTVIRRLRVLDHRISFPA